MGKGRSCSNGKALVKIKVSRHKSTNRLKFNQKFIECSPCPTHYYYTNVTSVKQMERTSRKRLSEKEYLGKYKIKKGEKSKDIRDIRSLSLSQNYMNLYIEGLLTYFTFSCIICLFLRNSYKSFQKARKNHSL